MATSRLGAMILGIVGLAYSAFAAALLINFDTAPGGGAVANGTVVDTLYTSQGVTFNREGGTTCWPNVYANNNDPVGFGSPPNVVSTCAPPIASDINNAIFGVIHAVFNQTASQVCIDVRPDGPTHFATLRVFDGSDVQIGIASSTPGVLQTLCVNAVGILGARFAGGSATAFARFDNFSVTFAAPPSATVVPTLGGQALLLLAAALLVVAAVRRPGR